MSGNSLYNLVTIAVPKRITISLLCTILVACFRVPSLPETTMPEALSFALSNECPLAVLLGDYHSINKYSRNPEFKRIIKDLSIQTVFCLDLSLQENRYLSFALQLEGLPALLLISKEGHPLGIHYCTTIDGSQEVLFTEADADYYESIICLSEQNNGFVVERTIREYPDDFYYNYVKAMSLKEKKDSAFVYYSKAFSLFDNQSIYRPLYFELIETFSPSADVAFEAEIIDLGDVQLNEKKEIEYMVYNVSDVPLVFKSISVSCSCVSVKSPDYIDGHKKQLLQVSYQAEDRVGPIEQSITLRLNTTQKIHRIKVTGKTVK